jgi:hypothetical protein
MNRSRLLSPTPCLLGCCIDAALLKFDCKSRLSGRRLANENAWLTAELAEAQRRQQGGCGSTRKSNDAGSYRAADGLSDVEEEVEADAGEAPSVADTPHGLRVPMCRRRRRYSSPLWSTPCRRASSSISSGENAPDARALLLAAAVAAAAASAGACSRAPPLSGSSSSGGGGMPPAAAALAQLATLRRERDALARRLAAAEAEAARRAKAAEDALAALRLERAASRRAATAAGKVRLPTAGAGGLVAAAAVGTRFKDTLTDDLRRVNDTPFTPRGQVGGGAVQLCCRGGLRNY